MDVNLTGQVAASLIQNPLTIVSASAIGGLVAGGLTLLGVIIAHKYDADRDKENRKEEARMVQREERKKAYIKFMTFINRVDIMVSNMDAFPIDPVEFSKSLSRMIAEITLLSPEVNDELRNIMADYPNMKENFELKWKGFSQDSKTKIYPLMQAELASDEAK